MERIKKPFKLTIVVIIYCLLVSLSGGGAYADYVGPGGGGGGGEVTCDNYLYARTITCSKYGDGGGSWFIGKTNWDGSYNPRFCIGGSSDWSSSCTMNPLKNTDISAVLGGLRDNCTVAKGYEYYVYFGLVGRKDGYWEQRSGKEAPYRWGPYGWQNGLEGSNATFDYNSYYDNIAGNPKTTDDIKNAATSGTNMSGWKLTEAAATYLYTQSFGGSSIPMGVGYFCANKPKKTLTAYAVTGDGANLNNGNSIGSQTVSHGSSASVSKRDFTGYTFQGWRSNKASGSLRSGNTYTVSSLTSNTTIYAVYEKDRTLTAYAVTDSGANLEGGKKISSQTVKYKAAASVSNKNISGFSFVGWCDGAKICSSPISGNSYSVKSLTVDKNVYAVYKPFSATSSLEIKVKNESISKYNSYQDSVYAKPGDVIGYRAIYNPAAQAGYTIIPQKIKIGDAEMVSNTSSKSIGVLVNKWNNAFSIERDFAPNSPLNYDDYALGDINMVTVEKTYTIRNEVGKNLKISAKTNLNSVVQNTPKAVIMSADSGQTLATVDTSNLEDFSSVLVPYNFTNSISFKDETGEPDKTVLYAGESDSVKGLVITVTPKENGTVNSTYATIVRKPKVEVKLCYHIDDKETCETKTKEYDSLNGGNGVDIFKENLYPVDKITMDIPDVPAGTKMCVRASVYPATSGADTNYQDPEGNHQWSEAAEKCYIVAKRPSLQVWGGNIYSNGAISTALVNKKRLANHNDGDYTFGSWGELGIISNGKVTGLASGAGLGGYTTTNDNGESVFIPGGLAGGFCKASTLSFANDKCKNETGSLGATLPLANDKESIKNRLEDLKKSGVNVIMPNKGEENVYIKENIINMDPAKTLDDLPKTVVYAENDIYIRCEEEEDSTVTRIDAVLIAENNVVTCADQDGKEPDIDSIRRSHRLVINGAIIAGKLIANRTYGAATGNDSMVPAEIINFDPTLYLWGNIGNSDDNTTNINMTTNYIRELPPRY